MKRPFGLLWVVGFFGWLGAADAQAPPATAGASFDGTYRFVSSARVNQTYTTKNGRMGACPDRRPGPLHVVRSRARYTTATGYKLRGTVGPQGELAMRILAPPNSSNAGSRPIDIIVNGTIDGTGTARVRQSGGSCSYDFVWRK
jgi:hypothetical protein